MLVLLARICGASRISAKLRKFKTPFTISAAFRLSKPSTILANDNMTYSGQIVWLPWSGEIAGLADEEGNAMIKQCRRRNSPRNASLHTDNHQTHLPRHTRWLIQALKRRITQPYTHKQEFPFATTIFAACSRGTVMKLMNNLHGNLQQLRATSTLQRLSAWGFQEECIVGVDMQWLASHGGRVSSIVRAHDEGEMHPKQAGWEGR